MFEKKYCKLCNEPYRIGRGKFCSNYCYELDKLKIKQVTKEKKTSSLSKRERGD